MSTIVTRSGKGAALTHTEVDANFTNLNTDKADISAVILATQKGAALGVVPLDAASKISSTYLPSYVDDVLEYANLAALPSSGETGKIYVALDTNKAYRWSGSDYIYITSGAVDSVAGKTGLVTLAAGDIGGLSNSATVDATDAGNISSGILAAGRLPPLTGDIITVSGSAVTSLAASGVSAGTYGNATQITPLSIDTKGRVVSAGSPVTIAPTFANIVFKPTTLSGFGITDALNTTGNTTAPLVNGDIGSAILTTTTTTAGQVLDANPLAIYRSIHYVVQITSGSAYQACNLTVIHDGTAAYITEYGDLVTNGFLAYFDADISDGNLRLLTTPVNAGTTYKAIKSMIDV